MGNITTLGLAYKTFNVDNKMIAHQLVNFVVALREVPSDTSIKMRNIDVVHKMIVPKLRAQIDKMFINEYSHTLNLPVTVNVSEVKPLAGGDEWEINWVETTPSSTSANAATTHWSSVLTFVRQDSVNPAVQIVNPIGLFVTYVHPVEDISDGDNKNL